MSYRPGIRDVYRQSTAVSWTRIDMLLALYDATLTTVEIGQQRLEVGGRSTLVHTRLRAQRLLTELIAGIDSSQGELTQNIQRLLVFCTTRLADDEQQNWADAHRILQQLRGAFSAIREQALHLEQAGVIPELDCSAAEEVVAVG